MRLWVVEMWVDTMRRKKPHWAPTVRVALNREEGRSTLRDWKTYNPHDRFRLVPYAREPQSHEGKP